jgi:RimJ/RimL family protein N-acetyltransferase
LTPPTLTTDRLILRAYRPADFEAYAAMLGDPEFARYLGAVSTEGEDLWSRFVRHAGMWPLMDFGFFAVEERSTGTFVGDVGFQERKRDLTPSIAGTLETGWGFVPSAQGRGYATEAANAALRWADGAFPEMRQTSLIDAQNQRSLRLADRLGFREFARTLYHDVPVVLLERQR